jgi:hypothetical protein
LEVMTVARICSRAVLLVILTVLVYAMPGSAADTYILEPGLHEIELFGQAFEIETEVTIDLTFEFVDEFRVTGSVTVLDSIGAGWVTLTWVSQSVVILDEIVDGSVDFDHHTSETGHAERKNPMKRDPSIPANPQVD